MLTAQVIGEELASNQLCHIEQVDSKTAPTLASNSLLTLVAAIILFATTATVAQTVDGVVIEPESARLLSLEDLDVPLDITLSQPSDGITLSLDALGETSDDEEEEWQPRWKRNLRSTVDISGRPIYTEQTGDFSNMTFVGVDIHKVFANDEGDWGTLILQPYLTRIDNLQRRPGFFDDAHDWEMVYRICNFNYTKHGRGKFNVRVGHMEVPYGLEQVVNTNGTLRDYIHGRNIGVKGDWGVSLNGVSKELEYEVALLRGSGNEWRGRDDPYLVAGRTGSPRGEPISVGISALHGDVYRYGRPIPTIRRTRVAIDFIGGSGPFTIMGEVSLGRDPGTTIVNTVLEFDWHSKNETWLVYNQILYFNADLATGWDTNAINNLGVRWAPNNHWALSGQWSQDIVTFRGRPNFGVFALQARYRF